MATINTVEEIKVWQDGVKLSSAVIKFVNREQVIYGLKDQMIRSAVSIPSNIAEGFEYHNNKEFLKFLKYARGSAAELKMQLIIYKEATRESTEINNYIENIESIIKQIQKLTGYLRTQIK